MAKQLLMDGARQSLARNFEMQRFENGWGPRTVDTVAAEEPLSIWLRYWFKDVQTDTSLAVTMRTPGHDRELAMGFLFGEGIIQSRADVVDFKCIGGEDSNEISIELAKGVDFDGWWAQRRGFISSSCGICGRRAREALAQQVLYTANEQFRISAEQMVRLPDLLRALQVGFLQTGGLHAAALVNADGQIESVFEDIGRHNALDKLIGSCVVTGRIPLSHYLVFLSSRSSFELVQKAAMAGAPVLATVGSPSSLAIETARGHGITLAGFVGGNRFNLYSGEWRIIA